MILIFNIVQKLRVYIIYKLSVLLILSRLKRYYFWTKSTRRGIYFLRNQLCNGFGPISSIGDVIYENVNYELPSLSGLRVISISNIN